MLIGAYHFFSYDSSGDTQAKNFIRTVPVTVGALPPVVDVEFYGDKEKNPPDRNDVTPQLRQMLVLLEQHYGQKPILYSAEKAYHLYLLEDYSEYPI